MANCRHTARGRCTLLLGSKHFCVSRPVVVLQLTRFRICFFHLPVLPFHLLRVSRLAKSSMGRHQHQRCFYVCFCPPENCCQLLLAAVSGVDSPRLDYGVQFSYSRAPAEGIIEVSWRASARFFFFFDQEFYRESACCGVDNEVQRTSFA